MQGRDELRPSPTISPCLMETKTPLLCILDDQNCTILASKQTAQQHLEIKPEYNSILVLCYLSAA